MDFAALVKIETFTIFDEDGDREIGYARIDPDKCRMAGDDVALLRFEHGHKRPDSDEVWDDRGEFHVKHWGQTVVKITPVPGWRLFVANTGKWDIRMTLVRVGLIAWLDP